jgi:hypothetical protein
MRKLAMTLGATAALASFGPWSQVASSAGPRLATASFAAYVAAFNSESGGNQLALSGVIKSSHVNRAMALKQAQRSEPNATVLGSGLGVFRAVYHHDKPIPVWVFALDPRGPHITPDQGPLGNHAIAKYNYDVIIASAKTGAVMEEAQGWDKQLPPLPPEPAK